MNEKLVIAILAAGKGTRMNSEIPKVLHEVNGKSMIQHVINTAYKLSPFKIISIVGFKKELVMENLTNFDIEYVIQKTQKGTGHAVEQCRDKTKDINGNILVLSGDVPLISKKTLSSLINVHCRNNSEASLISAKLANPFGYGRITRNSKGNFKGIIEHKDANENELLINEINAGIYIFNIRTLFEKLTLINNDNKQNEYYIGDVLNFIDSNKISIIKTSNSKEILGVNNLEQLNEINE